MLPQITNPDDTTKCCDPHAQDGTKCACVAPQINDPDNAGKCCQPDSTDNTKCAQGNFYFLPLIMIIIEKISNEFDLLTFCS